MLEKIGKTKRCLFGGKIIKEKDHTLARMVKKKETMIDDTSWEIGGDV